MKNRDLFVLMEGIKRCMTLKEKAKEGNVVKFHYACSKNKAKLESEIKHLQNPLMEDKEWDDFNKEKDVLLQKFAIKDENGTPKKIQLNEVAFEYEMTDENKELVKVELDAFIKEKDVIIKKREEQIKKYNELMEEESTIEIHAVSKLDIPGDIVQEQMDLIMKMIKDESDK